MATVTVLGAGMMGSALCVPIVDRGHEVRLVGTPLDGAIVESLKRDRVHPTLNKGHTMPEGITPYAVEELPAGQIALYKPKVAKRRAAKAMTWDLNFVWTRLAMPCQCGRPATSGT